MRERGSQNGGQYSSCPAKRDLLRETRSKSYRCLGPRFSRRLPPLARDSLDSCPLLFAAVKVFDDRGDYKILGADICTFPRGKLASNVTITLRRVRESSSNEFERKSEVSALKLFTKFVARFAITPVFRISGRGKRADQLRFSRTRAVLLKCLRALTVVSYNKHIVPTLSLLSAIEIYYCCMDERNLTRCYSTWTCTDLKTVNTLQ